MEPIDIHTHVFNLRYLPLSGIIRRYSHNVVPRGAAKAVANFMLNHTADSFGEERYGDSPTRERVPIVQLLGKQPQGFSIQKQAIGPGISLFDLGPDQLIAGLTAQVTPADLQDEEIKAALAAFSPDQSKMQRAFHAAGVVNDHPDAAMYDAEMLEFGQMQLGRLVEWVFSKIDSFENHLRWFVFMMNSEEDIFLRLKEKDARGVSTYIHLMMDVDHYFIDEDGEEHKSYYDFVTQQIPNMLKLQSRFPELIGFVAVDPSKANWQEILDKAIAAGFKGIKIYPPLGYHYDVHDETLAGRIDAILAYCVDHNLPLFTHCNNTGFEVYPGKRHSGYNSNPVYWARALERYPKLRLCLGHAGGGSGWFSEPEPEDVMKAEQISVSWVRDDSELQKHWNNSYAAQVLRLCVLYENVYCDASYLDEMVEPSGELSVEPSENFRLRLLASFKENKGFDKKIMYGSDWHMLFREAKQETYYSSYVKFMDHPELKDYKVVFFQSNARNYLQLP